MICPRVQPVHREVLLFVQWLLAPAIVIVGMMGSDGDVERCVFGILVAADLGGWTPLIGPIRLSKDHTYVGTVIKNHCSFENSPKEPLIF